MKTITVSNTSKVFGFGAEKIRVDTDEHGEPLFCASDVAKVLGYSNTSKAISDHCKGVTKRDTLTAGGVQSLNYIREPDLYRLMAHSRLPNAQEFEAWVFETLLPTIRKTGQYAISQSGEKKGRLELDWAKEHRLMARERRMAEKDALAAEKTRRRWAEEDRRRGKKELRQIEEKRRFEAELSRKAHRRFEEAERIAVRSGVDRSVLAFLRRKHLEVISDYSADPRKVGSFVIGTKWRITSEIAELIRPGLPWQVVANAANRLGLRFNPAYCRMGEVEIPTGPIAGKRTTTPEYSPSAQRMIVAEVLAEEVGVKNTVVVDKQIPLQLAEQTREVNA